MAADGNVSVLVARCLLLHRSRLATVPAPPGPARASPPLRQVAAVLSHVHAPEAGGHVSRLRRGRPFSGKLRDISRNCQHDTSRNYQWGKAADGARPPARVPLPWASGGRRRCFAGLTGTVLPGAGVACRPETGAAGRGLVSPPPGASRPAAGASLA